jgi:hypothetical protein
LPNRAELGYQILVQIVPLQRSLNQSDDGGYRCPITVLMSIDIRHTWKYSQLWTATAMGRSAYSSTEGMPWNVSPDAAWTGQSRAGAPWGLRAGDAASGTF